MYAIAIDWRPRRDVSTAAINPNDEVHKLIFSITTPRIFLLLFRFSLLFFFGFLFLPRVKFKLLDLLVIRFLSGFVLTALVFHF